MEKTKNNTFQILVDIWGVKEGKVTALKYENVIYHINSVNPTVNPTVKPRGVKEPYLVKWLRETEKTVFTFQEFCDAYPKLCERPQAVRKVIVKLLEQKKLRQIAKDRFQVIGEI